MSSYGDHLSSMAQDRLESLKRRGLLDDTAAYTRRERSNYDGQGSYCEPYRGGYPERKSLLGRRQAEYDDGYSHFPEPYPDTYHIGHSQYGGYPPPQKKPSLDSPYSSHSNASDRENYPHGRKGMFQGREDFSRGRSEPGQGRDNFVRGRSVGEGSRGRSDMSRERGDVSRRRGDVRCERGDFSRGRGDDSRRRSDVSRERGDVSRGRGDVSRGRGDVSRGRESSIQGNQNTPAGKERNSNSSTGTKTEAETESKKPKSSDPKVPDMKKTDDEASKTTVKDKPAKQSVESSAIKPSQPAQTKKNSVPLKAQPKVSKPMPTAGLGRGLAACLLSMTESSNEDPSSEAVSSNDPEQAEATSGQSVTDKQDPGVRGGQSQNETRKPVSGGKSDSSSFRNGDQSASSKQDSPGNEKQVPSIPNLESATPENKIQGEKERSEKVDGGVAAAGKHGKGDGGKISATASTVSSSVTGSKSTGDPQSNNQESDANYCQPCNSSFANSAQYNAHIRGVIHAQNMMKADAMKQTDSQERLKGASGDAGQPSPASAARNLYSSSKPAPTPAGGTTTLSQPTQSTSGRSTIASKPTGAPPFFGRFDPTSESDPSLSAGRDNSTPKPPTVRATDKDSDSDSDDDGTYCKVCKMSFDDRAKYIRHTKGLMHTQKKIEYEKSKGSTKYDDVPDTETNQVFAFGKGMSRDSSFKRTSSPHGQQYGQQYDQQHSQRYDQQYGHTWNSPQQTGGYGGQTHISSDQYSGYSEYEDYEEESYDPSQDDQSQVMYEQDDWTVQHLRDAGITDEMLAEANMTMPKQPPSERELRPEDVGRVQFPSAFHCKLCDAKCTSAVTFQSHLAGNKHRNNLTFAAKGIKKPKKKKNRPLVIDLNRTSKIDALFEEVTDWAVIGLDFITEYQKLDPKAITVCVCNLCEGKCDENTVISHVIGLKHKIRYMREKHPVMYEHFKKFGGKKSKQAEFAEELAQDVERQDGRGKVVLKVDLEDDDDDDDESVPQFLPGDVPFDTRSHPAYTDMDDKESSFSYRNRPPVMRGAAGLQRSEPDSSVSDKMRQRLKYQMDITTKRYGGNVSRPEEMAPPRSKTGRFGDSVNEMAGMEDPYGWDRGSRGQVYHGQGDYPKESYDGQHYQNNPEYPEQDYQEGEYDSQRYGRGRQHPDFRGRGHIGAAYDESQHQRSMPGYDDTDDVNKRRLDDLFRRGLITEAERRSMGQSANSNPDIRHGMNPGTERRPMQLKQKETKGQTIPPNSQMESRSSRGDLSFLTNDPEFKEFLMQKLQKQKQEQHGTQSVHTDERKLQKGDVTMKRKKGDNPVTETKAKSGVGVPGQIGDYLQTLSSSMISSEDEAAVALHVSNALTQALLSYRLRSHPGEVKGQANTAVPPPPPFTMPPPGFPPPGYTGPPAAAQPAAGQKPTPVSAPASHSVPSGTSNRNKPRTKSSANYSTKNTASPANYGSPNTASPASSTSFSSSSQNAASSAKFTVPNITPSANYSSSNTAPPGSLYPATSTATGYYPFPYAAPQISDGQYPSSSGAGYMYPGQVSQPPGQYQDLSGIPYPGRGQPPLPQSEPPKPPPPPPSF